MEWLVDPFNGGELTALEDAEEVLGRLMGAQVCVGDTHRLAAGVRQSLSPLHLNTPSQDVSNPIAMHIWQWRGPCEMGADVASCCPCYAE